MLEKEVRPSYSYIFGTLSEATIAQLQENDVIISFPVEKIFTQLKRVQRVGEAMPVFNAAGMNMRKNLQAELAETVANVRVDQVDKVAKTVTLVFPKSAIPPLSRQIWPWPPGESSTHDQSRNERLEFSVTFSFDQLKGNRVERVQGKIEQATVKALAFIKAALTGGNF